MSESSDFISVSISLYVIVYTIAGLTQVIMALYNYFFKNHLHPVYKSQLQKYLIGIFSYFLFLIITWNVLDFERNMDQYELILLIYLFIIPWFFIVYYFKIIYFQKKYLVNH
jgi:hypothetical protein